ncbi:MOSC and FAD-binding oxidoreductase domain-containing protein [Aliikangiella coralliicola]|uniref:MOSC domain-containing protein n=1 Tax=Aliikangiella coralliicola TaxID=2592383 RepID=A0A545UD73_9GAMM|nr:MOSC and FAD-binding oxidoreductase domain-containing protein [Aliikangiella coralliicola]TQV87411.1 MOSC domain-containing protein [Aliikangiella coralliicola]
MATIASIHTGKIRTYEEQGGRFQTAICQQSIETPVKVTKRGLEGNEVANHKNAIYGYCAENYDYWNDTLHSKARWKHGLLGENLTFLGLDEKQISVGDRIQIGEVLLVVSGCRTPCKNLLWRVKMPNEFLQLFEQSGRTGFYLEVLQTGTVKAGDTVTHLPTSVKSISIPDLARFFQAATVDESELQRLIELPEMGQQMLSMLVAIRNRQKDKLLISRNRWSGWKPFFISNIVQETRDVKSFFLKPAKGLEPVAGYRAGQFLSVRLRLAGGEVMVRCWSISSYDENLSRYRITIKREPNGKASRFMHDQVEIGDQVEVLPPNGQFTLNRASVATPVVLISAGIGITPMISMLQAHAARLDKKLPTLYFIHSTHNARTHAFHNEVERLIEKHAQFHSHYIYTRADAGSKQGIDYDSRHRLSQEQLKNLLENMGSWFANKWVEMAPGECEYYICGPEPFIVDVKKMLVNLHVPSNHIFFESFSAGDIKVNNQLTRDANVFFGDRKTRWVCHDNLTLLEHAEENEMTPVFSCRQGICGLCSVDLVDGEVVYTRRPNVAVAKEQVLLCCAQPKGDVTLKI